MTIDMPQADEHGYLTDQWLAELRGTKFNQSGARKFLLEVFPAAVELMQPFALVRISNTKNVLGKPVKEIYFATGGWSGAEDLIEAMLDDPMIGMHYTQWRRGGGYWFEVPVSTEGEG